MKIDTTQDGFKSWFLLKDKDICVCAPNKVAGTSFRTAYRPTIRNMNDFRRLAWIEDWGPWSPREVGERHPTLRKVQAVRDPIERFASLWRDKCRRDVPQSEYWRQFIGLSPDQLMDRIEAWPLGNSHWFPQALYVVPNVELVPVGDFLRYVDLPQQRRNGTAERATDPHMPGVRIEQHYAADVRLWRSVRSNS